MIFNAGPIEVVVSLPGIDSFKNHFQDQTSKFRFHYSESNGFQSIDHELWAKADVLITDTNIPTPEIAPNLKWVQFYCDYDLEAINDYRKICPNTVFTSAEGVNLYKKAAICLHYLLAPNNSDQTIYGATIGIIGFGSLGREIARLLKTFHCTILAAKFNAMEPISFTFQPGNFEETSGEQFDRLYPIQALPSMLAQCDYVINTLSLSNKSRSFVSDHIFSKVKPSTPVINATHPEVTDKESLQSIIDEGIIKYRPVIEFQENHRYDEHYASQFLVLVQNNLKAFVAKSPLLNIIQ